jgi:hypothetical protein
MMAENDDDDDDDYAPADDAPDDDDIDIDLLYDAPDDDDDIDVDLYGNGDSSDESEPILRGNVISVAIYEDEDDNEEPTSQLTITPPDPSTGKGRGGQKRSNNVVLDQYSQGGYDGNGATLFQCNHCVKKVFAWKRWNATQGSAHTLGCTKVSAEVKSLVTQSSQKEKKE